MADIRSVRAIIDTFLMHVERANVLRTVEAGDPAGSEQDHDDGRQDHGCVHDKVDENGDALSHAPGVV